MNKRIKQTKSTKPTISTKPITHKSKTVVIEQTLFDEIVKDGKYNESFSSILRRKLNLSNTVITPEQQDMEK